MFIFGGKKKETIKIQGDFTEKIKNTLKPRLCALCQKNLCSKVVFGQGVTATLTCKNCELKAVGNQIQKLSEKNLITTQKYSNLITSQLIAYQASQQQLPADHRKNPEQASQLSKKTKETSDLIREELRIMKEKTKLKMEELTGESQKQNTVLVFQEVSKNQAEKKTITADIMNSMVKRSLVSSSGVHFIDEKSIEEQNSIINERYTKLKNETKVKLKNLNNLIDEINNIKL